MNRPNFYVITGASGAGKSTLCMALAELGYSVVPEVALSVLQEAERRGEQPLAQANLASFMEEVLVRNLRAFDAALTMKPPVFFDRGFHECLTHMNLLRIPIPGALLAAAKERYYANKVFVAAPWPEIYVRDRWRRFPFESAMRSYEPTVAAYTDVGYEAHVMPASDVATRVAFVCGHVQTGT